MGHPDRHGHVVLLFNRVVLSVPPEVAPLGRYLIIGVLVPMVLRWLSSDHSPLRRWSSALYIVSIYLDIGALMVLRVACLDNGIDVIPIIMPVAVLTSLIMVQIRFVVLAPAILLGLVEVIAIELWAFEADSNRLFDIAAAAALVTVALTAAYDLERWTRIGWLRQRQLDAMARTDSLTGLENRRHLREKLRATAESADTVGLMILDVDHFKAYNDRYGHLAGDRCLTAVGEYLRDAAGADCFVARLGGEEFAALWAGGYTEQAERLRAGLIEVRLEPQPGVFTTVTASAGFAGMRTGSVDFEILERELFTRADTALHEAKHGGRDRLVEYTGQPPRGSAPQAEGDEPIDNDAEAIAPRGLRFEDPVAEAEFRAVFDAEGRSGRRFIMIGLLAVIAFLFVFADPLLKTAPEARRLGQLTLLLGLTPGAVLALVGNTWTRLSPWAPKLYIAGIAVVISAQMTERVLQLPRGFDTVPLLMPLSVLLSLTVVKLRFGLLLPAVLIGLAGIVVVELAAFPLTGNRILAVGTCLMMVAVTARFAYRVERARRIGWLTERRLDELTRLDPLTGLLNRRQFDEDVHRMLQRPVGGDIVYLLVDIDHFKALNDSRGYLAGDACLRAVGGHLAAGASRLDGMAARIGGEEFAVVWIDRDGKGGERAELLRDGISRHGVTASAGVAIARQGHPAPSVLELAHCADTALYAAKHGGRNRSTVTELEPASPREGSG